MRNTLLRGASDSLLYLDGANARSFRLSRPTLPISSLSFPFFSEPQPRPRAGHPASTPDPGFPNGRGPRSKRKKKGEGGVARGGKRGSRPAAVGRPWEGSMTPLPLAALFLRLDLVRPLPGCCPTGQASILRRRRRRGRGRGARRRNGISPCLCVCVVPRARDRHSRRRGRTVQAARNGHGIVALPGRQPPFLLFFFLFSDSPSEPATTFSSCRRIRSATRDGKTHVFACNNRKMPGCTWGGRGAEKKGKE
ncbi:hypothetical protein F4780DRAFT_481471 [Xylariomycetidae sp. FL0641]|nr:hypothetical protein F4780DRAFT_481471 [Xylariomycetidae sp. FL0641]